VPYPVVVLAVIVLQQRRCRLIGQSRRGPLGAAGQLPQIGAGQDIRLDYDRKSETSTTVEASRYFANKLWNVIRFALMSLGGETPASLGEPTAGSWRAWPG
jgi:hypothetical protein